MVKKSKLNAYPQQIHCCYWSFRCFLQQRSLRGLNRVSWFLGKIALSLSTVFAIQTWTQVAQEGDLFPSVMGRWFTSPSGFQQSPELCSCNITPASSSLVDYSWAILESPTWTSSFGWHVQLGSTPVRFPLTSVDGALIFCKVIVPEDWLLQNKPVQVETFKTSNNDNILELYSISQLEGPFKLLAGHGRDSYLSHTRVTQNNSSPVCRTTLYLHQNGRVWICTEILALTILEMEGLAVNSMQPALHNRIAMA